MVEFAVVFTIFISIVFILDVPAATYAIVILGLMDAVLVASILFFIISFIMYLIAKQVKGKFDGFGEKFENKISFAYYKIDGERYSNFYPTDGFSKKKFYKEDESNLKMLRIGKSGKHVYVFDKVFLMTVILGTILFVMGTGLVSLVIYCFFVI